MKQKITVADYAQRITEALPQGVLLNTNGDKHNAMVIGWGGLGTCWSVPTFTVYVRENRYTKSQLDKTGVFTVSIPLDKADPVITKICGWQSGHNIDKVKESLFTKRVIRRMSMVPIPWPTVIPTPLTSGKSLRPISFTDSIAEGRRPAEYTMQMQNVCACSGGLYCKQGDIRQNG